MGLDAPGCGLACPWSNRGQYVLGGEQEEEEEAGRGAGGEVVRLSWFEVKQQIRYKTRLIYNDVKTIS